MPTETSSGKLGFQPAGRQIASRKGLERVADVDPRLTRSYYFDNRLLTEKDLNRDQNYLDGRLREVGQALGYGIMRGLEVSFDSLSGLVSVAPGVAVSDAGRVLELSRNISLDLGDRVTLMQLNKGRHRRLHRGLYAVTLQYAEQGTDIAEVFPTDLASKRGFNFDLITEGVKLGLVKLSLPLARQNSLQVRANLMARLHGDPGAGGAIPEDAVALGLLAISDDRPQWLDSELLRQPLRTSNQPGDSQRDLHRQYQYLFDDLMSYRGSGSLSGDFAASDYFRLLPPVGSLPKESVDPVAGRQGYFPEAYQVWVAPVRKGEVELIQRESMALPALDLSIEEPQDIVVLAPLSNVDFGHFAQRLQQPMNIETRKLPSLDLLRLRLYPKRPVHELDTDRVTWQAIWDAVSGEDLIYIRRPQRAAETRVSGIVLAQGINLPAVPSGPATGTPADNSLLQDEDSVFLNRINVPLLTGIRGDASSTDSTTAAANLESEFSDQAVVVQQLLNLCLRIEPQYDGLLWQTLLSLARSGQLADFFTQMTAGQDSGSDTPVAIVAIGASFGLDPTLVSDWNALAP